MTPFFETKEIESKILFIILAHDITLHNTVLTQTITFLVK